MATVDSLDLATLQNNPQSISEALEDALETTDGTIGQLKTDATSKKNDIDDLYDLALTAKNQIDSLLTGVNATEDYYTNSLDNSWNNWAFSGSVSDEDGIRIQRYGKIYVLHVCAWKGSVASGGSSSTIKSITSSDMTLPTSAVNCGVSAGYYGTGEYDHVARISIETNGNIIVYMDNGSGTNFHLIGNFIGVDLG